MFPWETRFTASSGLKHCRNARVYLEAVRTFLDTAENNIADIERYHRENDMRSFTVKIHALKSTSRIIGAEELGAFAEMLEKAGNDNDIEVIEKNADKLIKEGEHLNEQH